MHVYMYKYVHNIYKHICIHMYVYVSNKPYLRLGPIYR